VTRTGLFKYVTFDKLDEALRAGWMVVAPASFHSVLMWRCECPE
jgi:hypothetical protein